MGRSLSPLGFLQIYRNKRAQQRKFYAYTFSEEFFRENICLKFPLLGSFLVINLKKPKSRKSGVRNSTHVIFLCMHGDPTIMWSVIWSQCLQYSIGVTVSVVHHLLIQVIRSLWEFCDKASIDKDFSLRLCFVPCTWWRPFNYQIHKKAETTFVNKASVLRVFQSEFKAFSQWSK